MREPFWVWLKGKATGNHRLGPLKTHPSKEPKAPEATPLGGGSKTSLRPWGLFAQGGRETQSVWGLFSGLGVEDPRPVPRPDLLQRVSKRRIRVPLIGLKGYPLGILFPEIH